MLRKWHLHVFLMGEETQQIDVTQQIEYTEQITALIRAFADWFEERWPLASELLLTCKEHRQTMRTLS